MSRRRMHRRAFTATAAGFTAGVFATRLSGAARQEATPEATPVEAVEDVEVYGSASTRIHTLESADARDEVNDLILNDVVSEIEGFEGFAGYILGEVIDDPAQSLSIVVFDDASASLVGNIDDEDGVESTEEYGGDLHIIGSSEPPEVEMTDGYLAFRVHTSLPDTDPREFVPLATSEFLPMMEELPGFRAYFWYPIEDGFVAATLFDSEESAEESNVAAQEWAEENLAEYTDGDPMAVNAHIVYANLPIFAPDEEEEEDE